MGLIAASFWIMRPFIPALIWSTMIVVATWSPMVRTQEALWGTALAGGSRDDQRSPARVRHTFLASDHNDRRQCRGYRELGGLAGQGAASGLARLGAVASAHRTEGDRHVEGAGFDTTGRAHDAA